MVVNRIDNLGQHQEPLASVLYEKNRLIFITGKLDDAAAESVIQQLLHLADVSHDPIIVYINSPGGLVSAGLAILDIIESLDHAGIPICTVALGTAASMAAIILAGGTKGRRVVGKNVEIMIHQVLGGAQGQATDVEIQARQIRQTRDRLDRILSGYTGQSLEQIRTDTERDSYMNAEEAIAYGLADSLYQLDI